MTEKGHEYFIYTPHSLSGNPNTPRLSETTPEDETSRQELDAYPSRSPQNRTAPRWQS